LNFFVSLSQTLLYSLKNDVKQTMLNSSLLEKLVPPLLEKLSSLARKQL